MTLITLEDAVREFVPSVAYYESREPGLGLRFRDEVEAVVEWIQRFPEVPRLRPKGYRRVNLRTFPHYVASVVRKGTIGSWRLATDISVRSTGSRGYNSVPLTGADTRCGCYFERLFTHLSKGKKHMIESTCSSGFQGLVAAGILLVAQENVENPIHSSANIAMSPRHLVRPAFRISPSATIQ